MAKYERRKRTKMAVTYDKAEIKSKIFVPAAVESELRTNIENQLNKCGIFYRAFSRRKSASSLEHKFASKKYGGNDGKKIQDLIGIRINLYFQDDLDICKELFENIFELVEDGWAETGVSRQNFEAAKINGVFKLPDYLVEKISAQTWDMAIDTTFEIQLKTVFFEGWHEVEHDFRYKIDGKDPDDENNVWNRYAKYSRQLNSVVATLELCDRSMLNMFEGLSHDLYKNKEWEMMLRMHYRVRMSDAKLYDGIKEILEANNCELGKKLLKARREKLIYALNTRYLNVPLSVNIIIAILNDEVLDENESIKEIMRTNNVFNDGKLMAGNNYERRDLVPLNKYKVFGNKLLVEAANDNMSKEDIFCRLSGYLYDWIKFKYREIFPDMPEKVCKYINMDCGYKVIFDYDQDNNKLSMKTTHIAFDVGGRMWDTDVELWPDDNKGIWIEINNCMRDSDNINDLERVSRFSYPNFYKSIYSDEELKLCDIESYKNRPYVIRDNQSVDKLVNLISNTERVSPIVILSSYIKDETSYLDESWIGKKWLDGLYSQIKYYAHIYRCDVELVKELLEKAGIKEKAVRGVYVFWPEKNQNEKYILYDEQYIEECVHSRYRGERQGVREDKLRDGAQSFMYKLVDVVKKCNIS